MNNKGLLILLTVLTASTSFAQQYHATSLALGRSYMSAARGVDAFKLNPATLVYNQGTEFTFLSGNFGISNSVFSSDNYLTYFTAKGNKGYWNEKDKKNLRNLLKDGVTVPLDFGANIFTMVYKNMGFGIDIIGSSSANATTGEAAQAALDIIDFTEDYSLSQKETINGSVFTAMKFAFAYSHLLRKRYFPLKLTAMTAGVKLNYYAGLIYYEATDSELDIKRFQEPDEDGAHLFYNLRVQSATPGSQGVFPGSGFGLDLAGSAIYDDDWFFSIKLENLFGYINWDENTELLVKYEEDSVFFDDDGIDRSTSIDTTIGGKTFTTTLPVNLHIGVHYQLLKKLTLMAKYRQGLNESFGNVYTPRLGVGAEYRPLKWLPLRTGFTIGGKNDFLLGLGAGIDVEIFEFNLSFAMREAIWPTLSNGLFFAYDLKFKF